MRRLDARFERIILPAEFVVLLFERWAIVIGVGDVVGIRIAIDVVVLDNLIRGGFRLSVVAVAVAVCGG